MFQCFKSVLYITKYTQWHLSTPHHQVPSHLILDSSLCQERKRNDWDFTLTDYTPLSLSLRLDVPSPVDDVSSWRGDVNRVQDGPQYLAKRCGEDFRWKVGDVGGDRPARQELSHLVGESVAVVLKQAIPVTSVCALSQRREVIHEDLLRHFSLAEIHHCVRRPQHSPTRRTAGDPLPSKEELITICHYSCVPYPIQLLSQHDRTEAPGHSSW